jgi:hypothetical protein
MTIKTKRMKFTAEQFEQMAEAGICYENDRVELIDGEMVEMAATGHRHMQCVDWTTKLFVLRFSDVADVSVQNSVRISDRYVPHPTWRCSGSTPVCTGTTSPRLRTCSCWWRRATLPRNLTCTGKCRGTGAGSAGVVAGGPATGDHHGLPRAGGRRVRQHDGLPPRRPFRSPCVP